MTDKDVGQLWRECVKHNFKHRWGDMTNLIRKLVEERAERFYLQNKHGWLMDECRYHAKRAYDIDAPYMFADE